MAKVSLDTCHAYGVSVDAGSHGYWATDHANVSALMYFRSVMQPVRRHYQLQGKNKANSVKRNSISGTHTK